VVLTVSHYSQTHTRSLDVILHIWFDPAGPPEPEHLKLLTLYEVPIFKSIGSV
jgi:hypothetical protein